MIGRRIQCFFLDPVDAGRFRYRRYSVGIKCPGDGAGYHNAHVEGRRIDFPLSKNNNGFGRLPTDDERTQSVWPKTCGACNYLFVDDDMWQVLLTRLFSRSDDGDELVLADAPVGAMWDAHWLPGTFKGPDGMSLVVRTPSGDWTIDGPSRTNGKDGPGWDRTGTPPNITVRPSIGMGGGDGKALTYHAWLTNGVLTDC